VSPDMAKAASVARPIHGPRAQGGLLEVPQGLFTVDPPYDVPRSESTASALRRSALMASTE